jgi:hypothetical protein
MSSAGLTAGGIGGRFVAWGSNPMAARWQGRRENVSASMDDLLFNQISWLKYGQEPGGTGKNFTRSTTFKVVIAHLPNVASNDDYHPNNYDHGTREWLKTNFTNVVINAPGTCENSELPACLLDADLLIIGRQVMPEEI